VSFPKENEMRCPDNRNTEAEIQLRYKRCIRSIETLEDLVRNAHISIQKLAGNMETIINNLERALLECNGILEEEKYVIDELSKPYGKSQKNI
jgi:hypothetical protein